MVHLPLQDQRLGFLQLPDQGVDRVVSETTQHINAQMAVNDDVAVRLLRVRDYDNRLLLTVLVHRREKPTLTLAAVSPQLGVGRVQLVELQFHGWLLSASGDEGNHRPGLPISLRPPLSPFDSTDELSTP